MEFLQFSTNPDDYLRVYKGDSSDGTLIGEYSGSAVPTSLVSYTGSMYVEFTTSDAQLESATGFVAKYEVNFDLDCSANQLAWMLIIYCSFVNFVAHSILVVNHHRGFAVIMPLNLV